MADRETEMTQIAAPIQVLRRNAATEIIEDFEECPMAMWGIRPQGGAVNPDR
jgi:hypothetical protein